MNTVPAGGSQVQTFFMYLRKVYRILDNRSDCQRIWNYYRASSVAKLGNHSARYILSKDGTWSREAV
jgi:hypothetical protein